MLGFMDLLRNKPEGHSESEFPLAFIFDASLPEEPAMVGKESLNKSVVIADPRVLGNWATYSLPTLQPARMLRLRFRKRLSDKDKERPLPAVRLPDPGRYKRKRRS